MKHATAASLDRLEEVLARLRDFGALKEKARGVFYVRGKAALHFHEDPAGLFADIRTGAEWERIAVNTAAERAGLLRRVGTFVAGRGVGHPAAGTGVPLIPYLAAGSASFLRRRQSTPDAIDRRFWASPAQPA